MPRRADIAAGLPVVFGLDRLQAALGARPSRPPLRRHDLFAAIADERAEAVILAGLAKLAPDIPVVAEESVAAGRTPNVSGGRFWLVDPLDGTREFTNGSPDFAVNIG